jgi:plastocyanin
MRQQFAQLGGARGANAGGRGGAAAANQNVELKELDADKIDELFEPTPRRIQPGQVYTWDEAGKLLTAIRITVGVTDGTFSEIVTGDVKLGQEVVTQIVVPQTAAQRQSTIFAQPGGNRGFGGLQPGGGGGGRGGGRN